MKSTLFVALLVLSSSVFGAEENNNNKNVIQAATAPVTGQDLWAQAKSVSVSPANDHSSAPVRAGGMIVFDEPVDPLRNFRNKLRQGWKGVGVDKGPYGGVMLTYTKEW